MLYGSQSLRISRVRLRPLFSQAYSVRWQTLVVSQPAAATTHFQILTASSPLPSFGRSFMFGFGEV